MMVGDDLRLPESRSRLERLLVVQEEFAQKRRHVDVRRRRLLVEGGLRDLRKPRQREALGLPPPQYHPTELGEERVAHGYPSPHACSKSRRIARRRTGGSSAK